MLETGSILESRYVVLGVIRRGPTNVAYEGHVKDHPTQKVAIKVVLLDLPPAKLHQALDRFRHEAERCMAMDHPNVVKVLDFFVRDDTACLVQDYAEGQPLLDILHDRGHGLGLKEGMAFVQQISSAVDYCHNLNPPVAMHALQPAKMIVRPDQHIKIVDVGQSWADNPGSHATDYLNGIGSHGYSPIERYVAEHTVDQVSDIYALGATMYAIFSGRTPPAAVELVTGQVKLETLDKLNPEVPAALAAVVAKAMAMQKSARYQSIAELKAALDAPHAPPTEPTLRVRPTGPAPTAVTAHAPHEARPDDLPVRRVAPPTPAPAPKPQAAAAPVQVVEEAPSIADLPDPLRSSIPPVGAVLELEGHAHHLFGPKEIERIVVEVLSISADELKFACAQTFKKGIELKLRLGVPIVATGQSLASDAIVTVQQSEEHDNGMWHHSGSLVVPLRLKPILANLHEQERRVAKRFTSGFRVLSKALKSYHAQATDISATGFGFVSNEGFPVGEVHEFALDIDDAMQNAGGLKLHGKITHCVPRDQGGYRIGVRFVNLNETERRPLYHFLRTFHR